MVENSSSLLSISTFGDFSVKIGNKYLNQAKTKSSKRWKLLSYLITYRERNVAREALIVNLELNRNNEPQGSLAGLVYRLREDLRSDKKNREYLKTHGSAYTFNLKTDYWLDAENLEKYLNQSEKKAEDDLEKSYQLFKKALNLYKGDYLEEFNSEEWIWNFRNKYQELLINTLLKLDSLFKREKEYLKLWQLYNSLQQKLNFDERLLRNSIEVLIKAGNISTAKQKYNELISMYKDNDLIIPDSIKDLERELSDSELKFKDEIVVNTEEKAEGAYICKDRSMFRDIYKLEKRRFERDKRPRCITHLRLKSELKKEEIKKYSQKLLELLSKQLRAGDLICNWRPGHFNILLMDIEKEETEKVVNRIKRYFNSKYNSAEKISIISENYKLQSY